MLIEVLNLNFSVGASKILDDISFNISDNDFVTVIGPNGAGKSTLLKCVIGINKFDSGSVKKKKNLKIGYVPQSLYSGIPIKVLEFLKLRTCAVPYDFEKVIADMSIENLLIKELSSLSGGEIRKVLIARALLQNPDVLVMDEPAQNLDVQSQIFMYKFFEKIYLERKIAILMVSHDLHFVMSCTKNVICLFKHICCTGEPKIISKDPAFMRLFGDDFANINALYKHTHYHTHDDASDKKI